MLGAPHRSLGGRGYFVRALRRPTHFVIRGDVHCFARAPQAFEGHFPVRTVRDVARSLVRALRRPTHFVIRGDVHCFARALPMYAVHSAPGDAC